MKMKFFVILTAIIAIITISIPVLAEIEDMTEEAISITESVDSSDTVVSPSEEETEYINETETTEVEISEVEKTVTDVVISEDSLSEENADEEATAETAETQARSVNSIESYYGKYANTFGQRLNSAYSNEYSDAYVDITTQAMAANVNDLYIVGKNGFDIRVDRTFNSATSPMQSLNFRNYDESQKILSGFSKKYKCSANDMIIDVGFSNERGMFLAGKSFKGTHYSYVNTFGKQYFDYYSLANGTTDVTYTLVEDSPITDLYESKRVKYLLEPYVNHPQYITLNNGWCLQHPSLGWCGNESSEGYRENYYIFQDRFNTIHSLYIKTIKINSKNVLHSYSFEGGYGYTLNFADNNDTDFVTTHPEGFEYNLVITATNGDKYYFYYQQASDPEIVAITDRYDNIYRLSSIGSSFIITDMDGVVYTCNKSGITRTANGITTELVKYEWNEITDERDPEDEYSIDNEYIFTITKNSGTSPTISDDEPNKTSYHMTREYYTNLFINNGEELTYCLPYKVVLPTGAEKHFEYQKVNTYDFDISITFSEYYVSEYYETDSAGTDIRNRKTYEYDISSFSGSYYLDEATVTYYNGDTTEKRVKYTYDDNTLPISEYWYYMSDMSYIRKYIEYVPGYPLGRIKNIAISDSQRGSYWAEYTYMFEKLLSATNEQNYENYTYYTNNYCIPHTYTYKKDANTTIKTENILTEDGKSIATQNIYENDVLKSTTNYTYDTYGNASSQSIMREDGTSATTTHTHTYSNDGSHTIVTRQEYILDADDNEVSDIVATQTFDWRGNLISSTDANGNTTTTTYDLINRPLTVTYPDTSQEIYTYDIANNTSTLQVESGAKYYATFDDWGNRTKYERGSANYTGRTKLEEYTYDNLGQMVSYKRYYSGNDYTTCRYLYDYRGQVTEETIYDENDTLLKTTSYTYGVVYNVSDQAYYIMETVSGDNSTYASYTEIYNRYDMLVQTKETSGTTERIYTYTNDYIGNLLSVTDPNGNTTTYTYDYANRPLSETDALGNTKYYTYNTLGLVSSESDYMNNITHYTYDNAGRVLTVTSPFDETGNAFTKYYYDANGNVTRTMTKSHFADEDEETYTITDYGYDNMNRISYSAVYPTPTTPIYTNYTYSKNGMNRSIVSGNNSPSADNKSADAATTNYLYNKYGDLDTVEYEDIRYFYEHDIQGRLKYLEITDFGLSDYRYTQYTYDDFDNLTSRMSTSCYDSESDVNVSYTYNLMGQRTSMTDSTGTTNYTYSPFGELTQETKGGIIKTYTYDALSNRTGFTLTSNDTQQINSSYTYDALNRLTGYSANGYTTAYSYDANSNMTSATKVDGTVETSTYNLANMLTSTIRTDENGDSVDRYYYKYYYDGKIYSKKNFDQDLIFNRFKYDGAGRISMDFCTGDLDGYRDLYTYDTRGNIIAIEHTNNEVSPSVTTNTYYTYDKANRLITRTDGTDTYRYVYLTSGDISTVKKNGTDIRSYGYDAAGRLISSVADGISATYTYDGNNMRQTKTIGSVTTNEIYDGANLVATITSGNVNKYLRGTRLEAYQTPDESGMYTSGVSYGIIRTMPFDENGNTSELDYDLLGYTAFGKYQLNSANTNSVNPFGYNGEVTDTDTGTGLIYLRNRYYDPEIGRFLTVDPAMDGTNWYSYCNNDPVNFEDPWGMEYDSLRNLMFDYMGAFDGEYSLNFSELNGKGYAYVTLGKYERAFYYDGTIIDRQYDEYGECTETTTKVADNIDGTLYMERSAFVAAMGMTKDGTATVKYTEPVYVSKSMSTVDFIDHIIASYSFTGDVENVINLVSKVPIGNEIKIAVTAGKLISDIGNNTMLSMGYYQYEVVSVQSPYREWYSHKTTTLYGIENDTKYYQNVNKYGGIYGIYFGQ